MPTNKVITLEEWLNTPVKTTQFLPKNRAYFYRNTEDLGYDLTIDAGEAIDALLMGEEQNGRLFIGQKDETFFQSDFGHFVAKDGSIQETTPELLLRKVYHLAPLPTYEGRRQDENDLYALQKSWFDISYKVRDILGNGGKAKLAHARVFHPNVHWGSSLPKVPSPKPLAHLGNGYLTAKFRFNNQFYEINIVLYPDKCLAENAGQETVLEWKTKRYLSSFSLKNRKLIENRTDYFNSHVGAYLMGSFDDIHSYRRFQQNRARFSRALSQK